MEGLGIGIWSNRFPKSNILRNFRCRSMSRKPAGLSDGSHPRTATAGEWSGGILGLVLLPVPLTTYQGGGLFETLSDGGQFC